jgi:hypothetical protein
VLGLQAEPEVVADGSFDAVRWLLVEGVLEPSFDRYL